MIFTPEAALGYARLLARPRRVGTAEEQAVVSEIAARFEQFGLSVERQPFEFSTALLVAATLEILLAQILILLTFWAWGLSALAGVVPAALLLLLLPVMSRFHRAVASGSIAPEPGRPASLWTRLCLRVGQRYATANVLATLPPAQPVVDAAPSGPHVFLMAHSDSKSQVMPLGGRMLLIGLAGLAGVVFAALSLLRPVAPALTSAAAVSGLLALVLGVPVLFLFLAGAGNASPGAIDNASGAGLVLHLAEVLAQAPPSLPVTFFITGAEELGVLGATAFLQSSAWSAQQNRRREAGDVYVLNFDGIGTQGRLAVVGDPFSRLARLVRACCVDLQLPLGRLPLIGALFDHIPFAEHGCQALSLVTLSGAARTVHTPADTPDRLHVSGFDQAGQVALRVIDKLAITDQAIVSPNLSGPEGVS